MHRKWVVNITGLSTVTKAIYTTAWDDHIVLQADAAGNWGDEEDFMEQELVNINTASYEELLTLPGIGPTKARAIITYRTGNPRFETPEDLDRVPGIGPATIELVRDYISF